MQVTRPSGPPESINTSLVDNIWMRSHSGTGINRRGHYGNPDFCETSICTQEIAGFYDDGVAAGCGCHPEVLC